MLMKIRVDKSYSVMRSIAPSLPAANVMFGNVFPQ